jgi:hypothetical protein
MSVKNKPIRGYAGGSRLFTQLPRRDLLENPYAGYREVMRRSTHNASLSDPQTYNAFTTCNGVGWIYRPELGNLEYATRLCLAYKRNATY